VVFVDLELKDKIAVITGGSKGIGEAVARGLAGEGVHLALCARNREEVENTARKISEEFGVKALGFACDVSKLEDIEKFVEAIKNAYPEGVDVLINNAGTGSAEKIIDAPDSRWQYYWDLHVMAAVRLSRLLEILAADEAQFLERGRKEVEETMEETATEGNQENTETDKRSTTGSP